MGQFVCFSCKLIYEVDSDQSAICAKCQQPLQAYSSPKSNADGDIETLDDVVSSRPSTRRETSGSNGPVMSSQSVEMHDAELATLLSTIGQKTRNRSSIHRRTKDIARRDKPDADPESNQTQDATQLLSRSALGAAVLESTSLISTRGLDDSSDGIRLVGRAGREGIRDEVGRASQDLGSTELLQVINEATSNAKGESPHPNRSETHIGRDSTMLLSTLAPQETQEGSDAKVNVSAGPLEQVGTSQPATEGAVNAPASKKDKSSSHGLQRADAAQGNDQNEQDVEEVATSPGKRSGPATQTSQKEGDAEAPVSKGRSSPDPVVQSGGHEKANQEKTAPPSDPRFGRRDLTDAINIIVDEQRDAVEQAGRGTGIAVIQRSRTGVGILGLVLFVLVLFVGWFLLEESRRENTPAETQKEPVPVTQRLTFSEGLTQLGMTLPEMRGSEPADCSNFIAISGRGLKSSLGPIEGVERLEISPSLIARDPVGEFVIPLMTALNPLANDDDSTLCISLSAEARMRDVFRIFHTAHRAKLSQPGLAVRRIEEPGAFGVFVLETEPGKVPAVGEAYASIGSAGSQIWLQSRDGTVSNRIEIPNQKPGQMSLSKIDEAFEKFTATNPLVRTVILELSGNAPLGALEALIERARTAENRERFTRVRLKQK